jgi:hypothetical protein
LDAIGVIRQRPPPQLRLRPARHFELPDSQQLQGEVQELALEALLRQRFARDLIEPVPKGEFGGDLIQRIVGPAGQIIGSILWEAKRTENWSDGWLGKLREDQRAAKADVCLIPRAYRSSTTSMECG